MDRNYSVYTPLDIYCCFVLTTIGKVTNFPNVKFKALVNAFHI